MYTTTMTQFKLSTHFLADAHNMQYSTVHGGSTCTGDG